MVDLEWTSMGQVALDTCIKLYNPFCSYCSTGWTPGRAAHQFPKAKPTNNKKEFYVGSCPQIGEAADLWLLELEHCCQDMWTVCPRCSYGIKVCVMFGWGAVGPATHHVLSSRDQRIMSFLFWLDDYEELQGNCWRCETQFYCCIRFFQVADRWAGEELSLFTANINNEGSG